MAVVKLEDLQWRTLQRSEGDSLLVDFSIRPRHIAVIPFEVLEDGLGTRNEEPLESALAHQEAVIRAIGRALKEGDWKELVNICNHHKLFQFWISRRHFEK